MGVRNFCFSENLACFDFLKHPFWGWPFCLITDDFSRILLKFSENLICITTLTDSFRSFLGLRNVISIYYYWSLCCRGRARSALLSYCAFSYILLCFWKLIIFPQWGKRYNLNSIWIRRFCLYALSSQSTLPKSVSKSKLSRAHHGQLAEVYLIGEKKNKNKRVANFLVVTNIFPGPIVLPD